MRPARHQRTNYGEVAGRVRRKKDWRLKKDETFLDHQSIQRPASSLAVVASSYSCGALLTEPLPALHALSALLGCTDDHRNCAQNDLEVEPVRAPTPVILEQVELKTGSNLFADQVGTCNSRRMR